MKIKLFVYLTIITALCIACGTGSVSDTTTVPFFVSDGVLKQNSECFNSSGELIASVYVFNDFEGLADKTDEQQSEPVNIAAVASKSDGGYSFNLQLQKDANYRAKVTCKGLRDGQTKDNALSYIYTKGIKIVVGNTAAYETSDALPDGHAKTGLYCKGCHTVGIGYQYTVINHAYVLAGQCLDCHEPRPENR